MALSRGQMVEQVIEAVSGWHGVESAPHRFGGVEWRLGKVEIGHAHREGLVDIPYTRPIRDLLLAEGRAEAHHILPDTGWTSFYLRDDRDIQRAIWLVKLSYIHKGLRRLPAVDFAPLIESLQPGDELRRLLVGRQVEAGHES